METGYEMESKDYIRNMVKTVRKNKSYGEIQLESALIAETLYQLPEYIKASAILIYSAYEYEVQTECIIRKALREGKKVGLPRVCGKSDMKFHLISGDSILQPGFMGIMEPDPDSPVIEDAGLIIIPGIAFDLNRNRIGHGGGYYDRYLGNHKYSLMIGLAFECQRVEEIQSEKNDIKMDRIITPDRII